MISVVSYLNGLDQCIFKTWIGIQQASILGPSLFVLYNIDIANRVDCTSYQCAEGTQISTY